jgi:hypothetical protein
LRLFLFQGVAVALWRGGELGVSDGSPVAAQVDGVHDRKRAAYSEAEAKQEADDGWQVRVHCRAVYRGLERTVAVPAQCCENGHLRARVELLEIESL